MLDKLMCSVITAGDMKFATVLLCMGAALALGILSSLLYQRLYPTSRSFAVTLALLPLVTGTVILVVNGNLGAGIAVAGSFSLIRFRSAQGSGREILAVFLAAALGLCLGAGYLGLACLLFLCCAATLPVMSFTRFGEEKQAERILRITIPEVLDYDGLFDETLKRYTRRYSLETVRTAEMGSVYQLFYRVTLDSLARSKPMLDEIRCSNGNLAVSLGRVTEREEM